MNHKFQHCSLKLLVHVHMFSVSDFICASKHFGSQQPPFEFHYAKLTSGDPSRNHVCFHFHGNRWPRTLIIFEKSEKCCLCNKSLDIRTLFFFVPKGAWLLFGSPSSMLCMCMLVCLGL